MIFRDLLTVGFGRVCSLCLRYICAAPSLSLDSLFYVDCFGLVCRGAVVVGSLAICIEGLHVSVGVKSRFL